MYFITITSIWSEAFILMYFYNSSILCLLSLSISCTGSRAELISPLSLSPVLAIVAACSASAYSSSVNSAFLNLFSLFLIPSMYFARMPLNLNLTGWPKLTLVWSIISYCAALSFLSEDSFSSSMFISKNTAIDSVCSLPAIEVYSMNLWKHWV